MQYLKTSGLSRPGKTTPDDRHQSRFDQHLSLRTGPARLHIEKTVRRKNGHCNFAVLVHFNLKVGDLHLAALQHLGVSTIELGAKRSLVVVVGNAEAGDFHSCTKVLRDGNTAHKQQNQEIIRNTLHIRGIINRRARRAQSNPYSTFLRDLCDLPVKTGVYPTLTMLAA